MNELIDITIPIGWTMFYSPSQKKVYGISELKSGGLAKTSLSVITKPTKAELMTEIETLRLDYTPPVVPPAAE
jgi:hypothetical protein